MELQLVRSATLRLTYTGKTFVIDPFLAAKHSMEPLVGKSRNPLVDLPCKPEDVLAGIEMAVISHLHSDHFDVTAQALLPKDTPLFCQPGDLAEITGKGFRSVIPVETSVRWQAITLTRTPGQHGIGVWAEQMGQVSGFVFQGEQEPTVYWAGDTIWYAAIERVIKDFQPDIIITHSSGPKFEPDGDPILMDAEQTIAVCQAAPQAIVIATHMEMFDFDTVSRADLRAMAGRKGVSPQQLLIPTDGEILHL